MECYWCKWVFAVLMCLHEGFDYRTTYCGISPEIWSGLLSVLHKNFQERSSRWEVTLPTFHSEFVIQLYGLILLCGVVTCHPLRYLGCTYILSLLLLIQEVL